MLRPADVVVGIQIGCDLWTIAPDMQSLAVLFGQVAQGDSGHSVSPIGLIAPVAAQCPQVWPGLDKDAHIVRRKVSLARIERLIDRTNKV